VYLPERDLIVLLLKQENFNNYFSYVDLQHLKDNYKELHYIYQALRGMHEEYPDKDLELGALQAYFFLKYPDADTTIYLELFKTLSETALDEEVGEGLLRSIKQRQQALKLSERALQFATGHGSIEQVVEASEFLTTEEDSLDETEIVSDDLEFLVSSAVQKPGLRWRLQCLNKSLGSLRQGDFGFLFARPETGKTTFLASEVSFMLEHLSDDVDAPILWLNMEEQGSKVMLRLYQAYFGVTLQQLYANVKKYKQEFQKRVAGRIRMVDDAGISRAEIDRLCRKWKPALLLQDQTSKIKGFAADREDLKLGAAFQWSRELAKEYCPVIGVHQADGSAENIKWLTMEHVANVKTAAQAEADWILGIGKVHAEGTENVRYLNISKNKLMGDSDSIPDLRHGRFEVYIEQERARYRDIVKYD
jgi:replicative DNA helicase